MPSSRRPTPTTGKPYADDFGWLSHTYDTPYLDVGLRDPELHRGRAEREHQLGRGRPGATPGTGGLGLAESTDNSLSRSGTENPQVFVPGNHSGFANLVPGNPATVDPPDLDLDEAPGPAVPWPPATYEYAVTDQFNGADSPSADQSSAFVTALVTVASPRRLGDAAIGRRSATPRTTSSTARRRPNTTGR